jgi:acetoin utilization deacetylase AcuC-like enzyme
MAVAAAVGGDDLATFFSGLSLARPEIPLRSVVLIHGNMMQAHAPPQLDTSFELPCRTVAIESVLRGLPVNTYVTLKSKNLIAAKPPVPYAAQRASLPEMNFNGLVGKWTISPKSKSKRPKAELQDVACFDTTPIATLLADSEDRESAEGAIPAEAWVPLDIVDGPSAGAGLWHKCITQLAPRAKPSWVALVHSEQHIREQIRRVLVARSMSAAISQGDMFYGPRSLSAALHAVGGAVEAVRCLFPRSPDAPMASFAIVRPPGHHCDGTTASGFCLFSNTATAAAYARTELGLERVAIVDTDYHPGDGSQNIFYDDASVLTISTHAAVRAREPEDINKLTAPTPHVCWPMAHNKAASFMGRGDARGMNINIPWPHEYIDDGDYEEAMRTIVVPALQAFKPQLILWACGFDAVDGDDLAGLKLSTDGYFRIARHLVAAVPGVPVAAVLEGGYNPEKISLAAENAVRGLLGLAHASGRSQAVGATPLDLEYSADGAWSALKWPPRTVFPSPHKSASSHRKTPLGSRWRVHDETIYPILCGHGSVRGRLARPEAVLEGLRRALIAEPAWQRVALEAGIARVFEVGVFDDDEPSVEAEAAWLEDVLRHNPSVEPEACAVPRCRLDDAVLPPVRNLESLLDMELPPLPAQPPSDVQPGPHATPYSELVSLVATLQRELRDEREARLRLEGDVQRLEAKVQRLCTEAEPAHQKDKKKSVLGSLFRKGT